MRRASWGAVALVTALAWGGDAQAQNFSELGQDLTPAKASTVDLSGMLRLRGDMLYNLDLDHGLTPSGKPLYPVPIADPKGQTLRHADIRLRTDVSAYAPYGTVRVNARIDVLDNLSLGSTPNGVPVTTTSQLPPSQATFRVKRAYGEALTPFGVIVAGRMGSSWGTGMATNGGDCDDCDSGDSADRIAFVTSQFNHYLALAYDVAWMGPETRRVVPTRGLDLDPSDDVRGVTFAILRQRDPIALLRRRKADKYTFDYGAFYAYRWQDNDVPTTYLATATPEPLQASQVMRRGFSASALNGWARLLGPALRLEAEVSVLRAYIEEASLIPGVRYDQAFTSLQYGGVIETEVGAPESRLSGGLNFGFASGDPAYGFGAALGPNDGPAQPGDLNGAQANPPYDRAVDNFQFHPDYRVDQILFREIIGTVTDAIYVRPHVRVRLWGGAPGELTLKASAVASWAVYASSTPGSKTPLGVELDPSLLYASRDGFRMALHYGVFFPGAGFDNLDTGRSSRPAQVLRARVIYGF